MTAEAAWLARHVRLLNSSYRHWTGKTLFGPNIGDLDAVQFLDAAPFAVVSHGTQPDPVFNYGNRLALQLFERDWQTFTSLPSRLSAEPVLQAEREQLLARVEKHGFIEDYSGVRISGNGKSFLISGATVWNLLDENKEPYGQAALIKEWQYL